jgi:hypothetical protein
MRTTEIYIVVFANGKWWIDYEGDSTGPFSSKDIATANAIALASTADRMGRRSEVRTLEDGRSRMLFQSQDRSALSRAAALV